MKFICKIFGHKVPSANRPGWYSPGEQYAKLSAGVVDGANRQHATVHAICERCGEEYLVCRVHLSSKLLNSTVAAIANVDTPQDGKKMTFDDDKTSMPESDVSLQELERDLAHYKQRALYAEKKLKMLHAQEKEYQRQEQEYRDRLKQANAHAYQLHEDKAATDTRLGIIQEAIAIEDNEVTILNSGLLKTALEGDVSQALRSVRQSALVKVIKKIQPHRTDMVPSRREMAKQIISEIKDMGSELDSLRNDKA